MTTSYPRSVAGLSTAPRLVTTALVAALLLTPSAVTTSRAAAAPLSAELATASVPHKVVHDDATGDVATWLASEESEVASPAPKDKSSDIVRTTVDHRAHRLVMNVELQKVKRTGHRFLVSEIKTTGGKRYDVLVDYSQRSDGNRVQITTRRGKSVPCLGVSWSTKPAAAELDLSVPRACLGDPQWVRVALGTVWSPANYAQTRGDDSRTDGLASDDLSFGPKQPHA